MSVRSPPGLRIRSLHARIMLMLTAVLGVVAAGLIGAAWYYAALVADTVHDERLVNGATQIAENMAIQGGVLAVEPPVAVLSGLVHSALLPASRWPRDLAFYKVVDSRGVVVAGSADLAPPPAAADTPDLAAGPLLGDGSHAGQPVRIAMVGRRMPGGWAQVYLAETRHARAALADDLVTKAVLLILAMSGLALGAALLTVRHALAPLTRVERALLARDPDDLTPLAIDAPVEIDALLAAINGFMTRLDRRVQLMRRMIGNAAHQIRTPLAALAAQLDLLSAETDEDRRRQQLRRAQQRSDQLGRLANQLLDHAMVIHRAEAAALAPVDLTALARRCLLDASLPPRPIDIAFEAPDQPVIITGDAISLREALSNLIHNALIHGAPTRLELRLQCLDAAARLEIIDDGPGIPPGDWQRVREPFQARSDDQAGAGLGLAIAVEALHAHGGELSFRSHSEEGFAVILSFPIDNAGAAAHRV